MPRPLPPNPALKATPPPADKVPPGKPPTCKVGVSSARERRRRSKQEGGRGRVVLKSRSAADLCKKVEEVEKTPPTGKKVGVDEPDSDWRVEKERVTQTEKNELPQSEKNEQYVEVEGGKDECDGGLPSELNKEEREGQHSSNISSKKPIKRIEERGGTPRLTCDPELIDGAVPVLNGHSSDEVEVDEFFSLLDTTLHLPDTPLSPTPFDGEDRPGPPVTAFTTEEQVAGDHRKRLPPGRLADRIKALRE